jgi:hypothetical protein
MHVNWSIKHRARKAQYRLRAIDNFDAAECETAKPDTRNGEFGNIDACYGLAESDAQGFEPADCRSSCRLTAEDCWRFRILFSRNSLLKIIVLAGDASECLQKQQQR